MIAAAVPASFGAAEANSPAAMEARVLAALNEARFNPQAYISDLTSYRRAFRGKLVTMPGTRVVYATREGTVPVDEAVRFLSAEDAQSDLKPAPVLAAAAAEHVAEQARSGRTGHYGANGSGPAERTARHGGGRIVAEVIAYGAFDARDVVRQLVVDDGVPDRGHRNAVFAARLRYAGVACGPHPRFRTMCVIDMAETPDGHSPRELGRTRLAMLGG